MSFYDSLRNFVRESLVQEKIRSRKKSSARFNMNEFRSIKNPVQVLKYARSRLELVGKSNYDYDDDVPYEEREGEGSSRDAFILTSRYALKVAKTKKGIVQNKEEIKSFNKIPKSVVDLFIKVYESDPDGKWMITDLVRPLSSYPSTMKAKFRSEINKILVPASYDQSRDEYQGRIFIQNFSQDLENNLDNWGMTSDKRIVILDYGASQEVLNSYYQGDPAMFNDLYTSLEDTEDPERLNFEKFKDFKKRVKNTVRKDMIQELENEVNEIEDDIKNYQSLSANKKRESFRDITKRVSRLMADFDDKIFSHQHSYSYTDAEVKIIRNLYNKVEDLMDSFKM